MNMDNEQLEQVTRNGGFEAFESADGKALYFAKREPGIWKVSPGGSDEIRVLEQGRWGYWALFRDGICLLNQRGATQSTLEFFNIATSQMKVFGKMDHTRAFGGSPGFAVSSDGRWILYRQIDQDDNDIMLLENFR